MNVQLLRDKAAPPGDEVLKNPLYLALVDEIRRVAEFRKKAK